MQLDYYTEDGPEWEWWASPEPEPTGRGIVVRHGFTMADIDSAARMALSRNVGVNAFTRLERYEMAWSAVVLALYEAPDDTPPALSDLVYAGWCGIGEARETEMRHHGVDHTRHVGQTRASFIRYWSQGPTASPEERVVERVALSQIWPLLTPGQQEALAAFAVCGSVPTAADALGKTKDAVHRLARDGRLRFQRAWHEGETVPARRGRDRRRPGGVPVHVDQAYRAARRSILRRKAA